MSFFQVVKSAASSVAKSAENAINDLKATPKTIECATEGCGVIIDVPASIFDWTCGNLNCKKSNATENKNCSACKAEPPAVLGLNPYVTCPKCKAQTCVPSSNASKHLKSAAKKTKEAAIKVKNEAQSTYVHLKAAPSQFNCQHCSTLLAVPARADWKCPRGECKADNSGESNTCHGCGVEQESSGPVMVQCGACKKATTVPKSNFANKVKTGAKDMSKSAKKVYYDIAGKDYIVCPRCNTPLKLGDKKDEKKSESGEGQTQPQEGQEPGAQEIVCASCEEKLVLLMREKPAEQKAAQAS